jgi:hypothetical protein
LPGIEAATLPTSRTYFAFGKYREERGNEIAYLIQKIQ